MPTDINKLVGKQVLKLRLERGLTQAQLAELLDVATETISRLERGVSIPSLKTLENISHVLNVTLKDIFTFEYPQSKLTAEEKEIVKLITFLKHKKAEEIRFGYNVLRSIFAEIKLLRKLK